MHVLFVSPWFPHPPSNGARLRVHHLLRALALHHRVTLLSFADEPEVDAAAPELASLCHAVRVVAQPTFDPHRWRSRLAWLGRRPRSLAITHSPAMAAAITDVVRAGCDVIVASGIACAAYAAWFADVPAVAEEIELGWLFGGAAHPPTRTWRTALTRAKYRAYLRRLLPRFGACTVVSDVEHALLAAVLGPGVPIRVVPNAVATADYPPAACVPDTVVFTGSFRYRPNYDAMRWFVGEVWPRVVAARPAARLRITGAGDDLALPSSVNVERTGFLGDVRPLLAAACVAVAPILAGGGTRVKILEAMAAGAAVVASSKGAEGLAVTAGEHLLVADDADAFASAVTRLLADAGLRQRLARAAHRLVAARYDWRIVGPQFESLVAAVATKTPDPAVLRRAAAPQGSAGRNR
jgi:glycosyltransferase involved in cell wall biosynthesis